MAFGRRSTTPFEKRIGYRFKRQDLLELALTHRSYANEQGIPEHYERLEFLGDAVLGLVTAQWLYEQHPELPEGELSKLKAQLVSRGSLAAWAQKLGLGEELRIGIGEERSGGRAKANLLADSMEAVFGAIYLDAGIEAARDAIVPMLTEGEVEKVKLLASDAKTHLQEITQALGWPLPDYRLVGSAGPDHSKTFSVECWLEGRRAGSGEGPSKKIAEQRAAADALGNFSELPSAPAGPEK
jgi:ribonuclease-3